MQQGPLAPRALPRLSATTSLAATVSSSPAFPVSPVIRSTLLHRFLGGTRTVSPVARHALATVLPLPPRRSGTRFHQTASCHAAFAPTQRARPPDYIVSRPPMGSLSLRPGDSLTAPRAALSVGFIRFVSSTDTTQATGLLTFTPAGLSPAEHASFFFCCWTHCVARN